MHTCGLVQNVGVTARQFASIALSLPDAVEGAHMDHSDFRVKGKIFASLPNESQGVLKLTPEQQAGLVAADPEVYSPCAGAWGRRGWTFMELKAAKVAEVRLTVEAAWKNVAIVPTPKRKTARR
jgi:hypothetical protein